LLSEPYQNEVKLYEDVVYHKYYYYYYFFIYWYG